MACCFVGILDAMADEVFPMRASHGQRSEPTGSVAFTASGLHKLAARMVRVDSMRSMQSSESDVRAEWLEAAKAPLYLDSLELEARSTDGSGASDSDETLDSVSVVMSDSPSAVAQFIAALQRRWHADGQTAPLDAAALATHTREFRKRQAAARSPRLAA